MALSGLHTILSGICPRSLPQGSPVILQDRHFLVLPNTRAHFAHTAECQCEAWKAGVLSVFVNTLLVVVAKVGGGVGYIMPFLQQQLEKRD